MNTFSDVFRFWNSSERGVCLAFIGDSVTQGSTAHKVIDHQQVYHQRIKNTLNQMYPQVVVNIINAGVGGDRATTAIDRLQRDVFSHQPDGLVIAFGLNDAHHGEAGLAAFGEALTTMVAQAKQREVKWVVLVTPPWMATADNPNVQQANRMYLDNILHAQNSGMLARYAQVVRDIGSELNVPVADVYARWEQMANEGVDTTALLANGLNHPNGQAHDIHAQAVLEAFQTL